MLTELNELPQGLLSLQAYELIQKLDGPTLIHLQGRQPEPLFVAVLMHGNETVGWEAVRQLLSKYDIAGGELQLPRSLSLFIGNVEAAAKRMRHLENQPDFNRIWPGCLERKTQPPEMEITTRVVETMRERNVFASIDLHNNTGLNPHYACINVVRDDFLHLATLFSRTVVYFTRPCGVASRAMADLCPSVTLECGKVGQVHGVDHARDYIEACLHLRAFPEHPVSPHDYDLFHTVATVKVPEHVSFGFGEHEVDINFSSDVDRLNFRELPIGTHLATVFHHQSLPLEVWDENGEQVNQRFLELDDGQLQLKTSVMPSMLTKDKTVIRQDCLCYLMERYQAKSVVRD